MRAFLTFVLTRVLSGCRGDDRVEGCSVRICVQGFVLGLRVLRALSVRRASRFGSGCVAVGQAQTLSWRCHLRETPLNPSPPKAATLNSKLRVGSLLAASSLLGWEVPI